MTRDSMPKWIGTWRTPRKFGARETRRVFLGYVSEVSRKQAGLRLRVEIDHQEFQAGIINNLRMIPSVPIIAGSRKGGMSKGDYGAIAELLVAADLISKGFGVFKAVSPQCECDLVYLDGGRSVRVEVKSGTSRPDGSVQVRGLDRNAGKFDVLAVALPSGEIHYQAHSDILDANYPLRGVLLSSISVDETIANKEELPV